MNLKSKVKIDESPQQQVAKKVNIVTLKMVRESSILYGERKITQPKDAASLVSEFLVDSDREKMIVVCLDIKCQPTSITVCSIGNLNSSIAHPREIFKSAILSNANSIILSHNHPSGDPTPSTEDISITKRIIEAGKILGIELTDHIIIGSALHFVSLKEQGII